MLSSALGSPSRDFLASFASRLFTRFSGNSARLEQVPSLNPLTQLSFRQHRPTNACFHTPQQLRALTGLFSKKISVQLNSAVPARQSLPKVLHVHRFLSSSAICLSRPMADDKQGMEGSSRGAFIVLEGIDRCGKSTQARRLVEHLNSTGVPAELWNFPDRSTPIGKIISEYLQSSNALNDAAIHHLFSANRWEKEQLLLQKLQAGVTLVVDRYAYSGVAFTAAKCIPKLNLEWCKGPDVGLPSPDLVLYFELPLDEAEKRGGYGKERYEKRDMQQQVMLQFESLRSETWHSIDASQTPDNVASEVTAAVTSMIEQGGRTALCNTLW